MFQIEEISNFKIAVLGAGTMGGGIAAHFANLRFPVLLCDVTRGEAQAGLERAEKRVPPAFIQLAAKERLTCVGIDEPDFDIAVSQCSWVCEAVIENTAVKRDLFAKIEAALAPDAFITTNTSGLPIEDLLEGRGSEFRKRLVGAHFFNPPRYLKLLELIPTRETDPGVVRDLTDFLELFAAKRVVRAKDTPGFIANRFGMWVLYNAIHTAEKLGLSVEDVDYITGPLIGRPKSAVFKLADIIGLDVMNDIATNLTSRLSPSPEIDQFRTPRCMDYLIGKGFLGEKSSQGFYKPEGKEQWVLDMKTLAHRMRSDPSFLIPPAIAKAPLIERLKLLLEGKGEAGEFLRQHLVASLKYAQSLLSEVAHSAQDFDRVMKWGFNWEIGPFEMIDLLGDALPMDSTKKYFHGGESLGDDGHYVKTHDRKEFVRLQSAQVVERTDTALVRDLGDGVVAVTLRTKQGIIGPELVSDLREIIEKQNLRRFVLASESSQFSLGYDLKAFQSAIESQDDEAIDSYLKGLQSLGELIEERECVAAVSGYCLGAGLELALSAGQIVAAVESKIGLPETRVGLVPGGRGCALMKMNSGSSAKEQCARAMVITEGITAINAFQARTVGYLRPNDLIEFHPDRVLFTAKQSLMNGNGIHVRPQWSEAVGPLTGMIDQRLAELRTKGTLSEFDLLIGDKVKAVISKSGSYEQALEKERSEFISLCKEPMTQTRIKHMLETGKALKN